MSFVKRGPVRSGDLDRQVLHFIRRGFPLWLTVTAQGPTVSFAVLPVIPLFVLAVNANVALPLPLVTEGTSQLWLEATVHPHPGPVIVLTSPRPPAAGTLADRGDTL